MRYLLILVVSLMSVCPALANVPGFNYTFVKFGDGDCITANIMQHGASVFSPSDDVPHMAAYIDVGDDVRWFQIGIWDSPQDGPELYAESMNPHWEIEYFAVPVLHNQWHSFSLVHQGSSWIASIDGKTVMRTKLRTNATQATVESYLSSTGSFRFKNIQIGSCDV